MIEYVKSILDSIGSVEKVDDKTIPQIKAEVEELVEVARLLKEFDKSQSAVLQNNSEEHKEFLSILEESEIKDFRGLLSEQKNLFTSIIGFKNVNDNLKTLAYNLGDLRAAVVSKDHKKTKRLVKKLLIQEDICIKNTMSAVDDWREHLLSLHFNHHALLEFVASRQKLEGIVGVDSNSQHLKKLHNLNNKQKLLVGQIARHLVSLSKLGLKQYRKDL